MSRLSSLMKTTPPAELDGAAVLAYANLADSVWAGHTNHTNGGDPLPRPAGLALCQYRADETTVYLFYCSVEWEVITDTAHNSVSAAMRQAEFEAGQPIDWQRRAD